MPSIILPAVMKDEYGYVGICYHYIRPPKKNDEFGRLLGLKESEFFGHLKFLKENFKILSPDNARDFSYGNYNLNQWGILITFDDGLSDHYRAAEMLAELKIKAFFFVPTCILADRLPPNPTIIHYALAKYGVEKFLEIYRNGMEEYGQNLAEYDVNYKKGDDPWAAIGKIKEVFKYKIGHNDGRNILLYIYNNLLRRDYPDILKKMCLTSVELKEMVKMGHAMGAHSHSHISISHFMSKLTAEEENKEIIKPRKYLEELLDCKVNSLSYPFGRKLDCLSQVELLKKTKEYELAFSIEEAINTKQTPPLYLGRYSSRNDGNISDFKRGLQTVIDGAL